MKEEEVKALLSEASEKIKEDCIPAMTNLLMDVFQHGINKGMEIGLKIGANTPQPNNHCYIPWNTGEPKDAGEYLVVFEYEDGHTEIQTASWSKAMRGFRHYDDNVRYSLAWCKLSDIEPYKEETK